METFSMIVLMALWIVPGVWFILGRIQIMRKTALYLRLIVDGVGCIALGRLFLFVKYLTEGEYPVRFTIGTLGMVGAFAFFLSANFGQINTIADDKSPRLKKYRMIALIVTIVNAIVYVLLQLMVDDGDVRKLFFFVLIVMSFANYFHLKLFILDDVDFGIVKCLKQFNFLALLYSLSFMLEIIFLGMDLEVGIYILYVIMIIISGLLVPAVLGGIEKWTT